MSIITELKLIFVGDENIGKTTLLLNFFRSEFSLQLDATLSGVNLFIKEIDFKFKDESKITLNIWDIAGNERFYDFFPILTKKIDGLIVSIGSENIQSSIEKWISNIEKFFTITTPKYLLAIKKDGESFDNSKLQELKEKYQFKGVFEVESKNVTAVTETFQKIYSSLLS